MAESFHNVYTYGDNLTITENLLTGSNNGCGARFYGSDIDFSYNYISGNALRPIYVSIDTDSLTHQNVDIHHNIMSSSVDNYFILFDNGAATSVYSDWYVYNNTFYNTTAGADGFYVQNMTNFKFVNNIVVLDDAAIGFITAGDETGAVVNYNIYYNVDRFATSTGYKTWTQWRVLGYDANSIWEDNPDFTTPGTDFTLLTGSPAINTGDSTLGATYDDALHSTSTWPDGVVTLNQDDYGLWEIGAYVYFTPALPIQGAAGNFKLN